MDNPVERLKVYKEFKKMYQTESDSSEPVVISKDLTQEQLEIEA